MEVILLEKVQSLGDLGDMVAVKAGFGRNYLIPYGKAVPATKDNVAKFEVRRAELEKLAGERLAAAQARADKLKDMTIEIAARSADEGRLFGSVGVREIVDAVQAKGVEIEKSEVMLPLGAIREIGEFEIELHLHSDVKSSVKLTIIAE